MKSGTSLKNRQGGAVAVMVGISIVLLVGFLALVIDLGHLYVSKTELQNAADAAALAGAKELNGKATGVASAVTKAIAIAAQNKYDFSKPVDITIANIRVGNCPDPGCMVSASSVTTDSAAANKYFIEVDTLQRNLDTWFAPIFGISKTSTFGVAVAGRYLIEITPLAMCALDLSKCPPPVGTCSTPPCECGYDKGKAYKVSDVNPIGPGTLYWLDPLATTPSCTVTNANDMRPFVCTGEAAVSTAVGAKVYTNTGISSGPLLAALDSRFNDYDPQAQCDPATAPPDVNVKEYRWEYSEVQSWMTPPPTQQASNVLSRTPTITTDWSGVVWSFVRPPSPNSTGRNITSDYPSSLTPYTDSANINLYTAQTGGKPERRVMNLVVVVCPTAGGVCREATVAGIGRFLLQRRANVPSDKEVYVEFGEFVPGGPNVSEYKLYR